MQVLIIEDEAPAAEKLQKQLLECDSSITILDVLNSVESSVEWLRVNKHPDLILLDIHLADGLCFDIFKQVKVKSPVIFCTAYDQYALKAFELNSIDYLLKPVQAQKLEKSLEKMKDVQQQRSPVVEGDLLNNLMSMIGRQESNYKSRFMVRIGNRIQAVKAGDIAYFYSRNKLTLLVTKDGQSFPVDYSLDDLIQLLDPAVFFHVNRSLIIHIDAAREIHPYFKGRLKLVLHPPLDEEVVVSSQRTPLFKDWLDQ
ncbi:LytR/AlgR family response regulator transcription factor [Arcticibacter sp. MXS-1]|uniref:LytR/AlgR family response regulator transcription factor n=1 Tax=Arcticibacter sp. MXS-1 TaxID=3341726 RepID=UPI0035A8D969